MYISFKVALIVSAVGHSLIILPILNTQLFQEKGAVKGPPVVEYIQLREEKEFKAAKVEKIEKLVKSQPDAKPSGNAGLELKNKADVKSSIVPSLNTKGEVKRVAQELAKKQTVIENSKDYINYYRLIREKIRQRLKENYSGYQGEGGVSLIFILARSGALLGFDIDADSSTDNKTLRKIATTSLKEASPFPPFPKAFNTARMSFNLTITFKKK